MKIEELLTSADSPWTCGEPADKQAMAALVKGCKVALPAEYLAFLARSNGGDGFLDVQPCYLRLWPVEEVLSNNEDYEIAKYLPGFFGIGDAGGEEFFAFDTRTPAPWKIYSIPYVPMELKKAWLVADDFISLMGHVVKDEG